MHTIKENNDDLNATLLKLIQLRDHVMKCVQRLEQLVVVSIALLDGDLQPNQTEPNVPKETNIEEELPMEHEKPQPSHPNIDEELAMNLDGFLPNQVNAPKNTNIDEELTKNPKKN